MGILCGSSDRDEIKKKIKTNDKKGRLKKDNDKNSEISTSKVSKNTNDKKSFNKYNNNNNNSNTISTNDAIYNKDYNNSNINNVKDVVNNNSNKITKVSTIPKNIDYSNSEIKETKNIIYNSDEKAILDQLNVRAPTKNRSESTNEINTIETSFNFKENNIPLKDGEKAGCKQYSINTFCLFKSNDNETFLVYSVKNAMERHIRIYALNMDNDKINIICEEFEGNDNANNNRRIPTQCKYYNIENNEYIIAGFRDSCIYLWELKNSEFKKIKEIENYAEQINGICLFKNKKTNELNFIFSEYNKSKINIMNFNEDKSNINIKEKIYFLEILDKGNKIYIIAGSLNKVISFEFKENPTNFNYYKNEKNLKKSSYGKGHECVVIYKPNDNENDIKIIDSDTEGKCINIFNFESTELLLILDLINCKPLGINIWNKNYIIVSCLESIDNNSIKIIKINLNKRLYNQKKVDLFKNEDGAEGKIVVNLKGHENGTISTLNMKNRRYGEFFVSIGKDQILKLWINNSLKSSIEFNI